MLDNYAIHEEIIQCNVAGCDNLDYFRHIDNLCDYKIQPCFKAGDQHVPKTKNKKGVAGWHEKAQLFC